MWALLSWPASAPALGLWSQWSCSSFCPIWWACRKGSHAQPLAAGSWVTLSWPSVPSCALWTDCRTSTHPLRWSGHPWSAEWSWPNGTLGNVVKCITNIVSHKKTSILQMAACSLYSALCLTRVHRVPFGMHPCIILTLSEETVWKKQMIKKHQYCIVYILSRIKGHYQEEGRPSECLPSPLFPWHKRWALLVGLSGKVSEGFPNNHWVSWGNFHSLPEENYTKTVLIGNSTITEWFWGSYFSL